MEFSLISLFREGIKDKNYTEVLLKVQGKTRDVRQCVISQSQLVWL